MLDPNLLRNELDAVAVKLARRALNSIWICCVRRKNVAKFCR